MKEGVSLPLRGSLIVILNTASGNLEARWMVGGGTLMDGILFAAGCDPNNKHIIMISNDGLEGCLELDPHTPDFYISFLVREANRYHEGSAWTLVEAFEDALKGEAASFTLCRSVMMLH